MEDLTKKLISIQQQLNAPKNLTNKFGGYKYRSAEAILEAVKPLLKQKKLALVINDVLEAVGDRYYIRATVSLTDGKETLSTVAYAREEETKKGMDGSQITGASSSYARKYALNGMFAIDDNKDSDATNDGKPEAKKADPLPTKKNELNKLLESEGYNTTPKKQAKIHDVLKKLTISSVDDAQKVIDAVKKEVMLAGANGNEE